MRRRVSNLGCTRWLHCCPELDVLIPKERLFLIPAMYLLELQLCLDADIGVGLEGGLEEVVEGLDIHRRILFVLSCC